MLQSLIYSHNDVHADVLLQTGEQIHVQVPSAGPLFMGKQGACLMTRKEMQKPSVTHSPNWEEMVKEEGNIGINQEMISNMWNIYGK